jgi:hypothetical protein
LDSAPEYAGISSAREDYLPLEREFGFDDFFSKSKLTKVYTAPVDFVESSSAVAPTGVLGDDAAVINETAAANEAQYEQQQQQQQPPPALKQQRFEKKTSIPKGVPVAPAVKIPAFLQATPYFNDYKKHQLNNPEQPLITSLVQDVTKPVVQGSFQVSVGMNGQSKKYV